MADIKEELEKHKSKVSALHYRDTRQTLRINALMCERDMSLERGAPMRVLQQVSIIVTQKRSIALLVFVSLQNESKKVADCEERLKRNEEAFTKAQEKFNNLNSELLMLRHYTALSVDVAALRSPSLPVLIE